MNKTILALVIFLTVLFSCKSKKKEPQIIIKTVTVYRDTCDSDFINKIAQIETGANDSLSGENGMGRGRYGIYEVCVLGSGLNALLGYTHEDMHDKDKADKVFWAMMGIFNYLYWQKNGAPPSYEDLARMWSGGPMGYEKEATLRYLEKFKNM